MCFIRCRFVLNSKHASFIYITILRRLSVFVSLCLPLSTKPAARDPQRRRSTCRYLLFYSPLPLTPRKSTQSVGSILSSSLVTCDEIGEWGDVSRWANGTSCDQRLCVVVNRRGERKHERKREWMIEYLWQLLILSESDSRIYLIWSVLFSSSGWLTQLKIFPIIIGDFCYCTNSNTAQRRGNPRSNCSDNNCNYLVKRVKLNNKQLYIYSC